MSDVETKPWRATDHAQLDASSTAQQAWAARTPSQRMRQLWQLSESLSHVLKAETNLAPGTDAFELRNVAQYLAGAADKLPALLTHAAMPSRGLQMSVQPRPFGCVGLIYEADSLSLVHAVQWSVAALTAGNSLVIADIHGVWREASRILLASLRQAGIDSTLLTVLDSNPAGAAWITTNHPAIRLLCLFGAREDTLRNTLSSLPDEPLPVETLTGHESSIQLLRLFSQNRRIAQAHIVNDGGFQSGY